MNFKKQVMRYRLKADQKIGRANKNEVLNDELLQIEKRLENTRTVCVSVYKRISQCLQPNCPDLDKRVKKMPETAVANAMLEASNQLSLEAESSLQKSLKVCAEAEKGIATQRAVFEMYVEEQVVSPLQTLSETDIPNIHKLRERLKRLVLDRDNAQVAYQKANKAQYHPGANVQQVVTKADATKDELDAAALRMDLCKDQLITELFEFLAKEGTYANRITDFVAKELEYHKKCVEHLEKLEPELRAAEENANLHSSYGAPLADHLRMTERQIAIPIESCIACLLEIGIYEEGLFRLAGGAAKLKKFRAIAGAGVADLSAYDAQEDVHAVSGALKQYLRDLPDPLLCQALYSDWIAASSITDNDAKMREIWSLVDRLPPENKANLGYLIRFCSVVASKQEYNKMTAGNIALVLAPNLLWAPSDDISANMMVSNSVAGIIESMITYDEYYFPDGPKFKAPAPPEQTQDMTHGRTSSASSLGESTSFSSSSSGGHQKSPSHSRNSSSDTNIILNHHQGDGSTTPQKTRKKRAPPAPVGPPPPAPTSQGQSRTPAGASGGDTSARPPVASKRMSVRPNMPPPAPPDPSGGAGGGPELPPKPQTRPKPVLRKKPSSLKEEGAHKTEPAPTSPPVFKRPPSEDKKPPSSTEQIEAAPPLPADLGPAEISWPATGEQDEASDEDEKGFIVTCL